MPWFQSFFRFLHHFVMTKLASSSIRVKSIMLLFVIFKFPYDNEGLKNEPRLVGRHKHYTSVVGKQKLITGRIL